MKSIGAIFLVAAVFWTLCPSASGHAAENEDRKKLVEMAGKEGWSSTPRWTPPMRAR